VHAADRAPFREPALAARIDHLAARWALRPGYPLEDGRADPSADAADATPTITSAMTAHSLIISRPAWALREQPRPPGSAVGQPSGVCVTAGVRPGPGQIGALEAAALAKPRPTMTPAEIRALAAEAIAHLHEVAGKLAELSALLGDGEAGGDKP